ncbi:MAG: hypothetical protein H0U49_10945, partial [Parachlamydiaceae bacterium]|nr:hypothetical protein [Parachlamydiaceae bacterium]
MKTSLSLCLTENRDILGTKYENLGKRVGGFLIGHKVMLSYDKKTGYKIEKLNIFQLFFRKLGFYKSTHLNFIDKKICRLDKKDSLTDKCHARINALWAKKNIIALGNSTPSEAKVIGFAERHGDHSFRANTARQINALYKKGDIVLVEGSEAGKIITGKHQMTGNLNPGCTIRGWEPDNFKTLTGDFFKKGDENSEEIKACLNEFKNTCENKGKLSSAEATEIKGKIEKLKEKIKEWNKYYKSDSDLILNAGKI